MTSVHPNTAQPATVLVMTKTPEAGKVKTRLAASWDDTRALNGYMVLVKKTLRAVEQSGLPKQLHIAGDLRHPLWQQATLRGWKLFPQQGQHLGERMQAASSTLPCILVGCDFPALSGELLADVNSKLQQHDAVAIPATDGGYVLLALNHNHASLFHGHHWGSETVWGSTYKALQALGSDTYIYAAENDLDTAADWQEAVTAGLLPPADTLI